MTYIYGEIRVYISYISSKLKVFSSDTIKTNNIIVIKRNTQYDMYLILKTETLLYRQAGNSRFQSSQK